MKDSIREMTQIPELTMGLDLGDKFSYYCIIDQSGKRVEEGRVKTQLYVFSKNGTLWLPG